MNRRDVLRTFRDRAEAVSRGYALAVLGDSDAVHDLRVATRRLRVALRLLAARPRGKRARRAERRLREIATAAGRYRDLDVGTLHLGRLRRKAPREDAGWASLLRSLRRARSLGRARGAEALLDCDLSGLRSDLRRIRLRLADPETIAARLAQRRLSQGGRIAEELAKLRAETEPEPLHAIRRRLRRLRYADEIGATLTRETDAASRTWRRLQTTLGEIQDREVLALWLDAWASRDLPEARADAARAAREAASALREERDSIYRRLLEDEPAAAVRAALAPKADAEAQREVGGGVPPPNVQPTITLISG